MFMNGGWVALGANIAIYILCLLDAGEIQIYVFASCLPEYFIYADAFGHLQILKLDNSNEVYSPSSTLLTATK